MASERRLCQVATTIPVRNVQALAARSADELPAETLDQYIRPAGQASIRMQSWKSIPTSFR
jgi:hypothetical protein